jgi:hypothetical protein
MLKWVYQVSIVVGAIALSGGGAWANPCFDEAHPQKSFRQMVDESDTIVLAKVTGGEQRLWARKGHIDFDFEVIEILKGSEPDPITINGLWIKNQGVSDRGDLESHHSPAFWDRKITRLASTEDCRQTQKFELFGTYLLFDPHVKTALEPLSVKSELIGENAPDQWVEGVRILIENPDQEFAYNLSGPGYLAKQWSVALIAVEHCTDKLRGDAHHLAQFQTMSGKPLSKDDLSPAHFASALEGCDGFTAKLGIFYRPDRQVGLPIDVNRKPMQQFIPIVDGLVDFTGLQTQIGINDPKIMPIDEVAAALQTSDVSEEGGED